MKGKVIVMFYTDEYTQKQVLAMAYVIPQKFCNIYPIDKGFYKGTLFQELDKPFMGGCSKWIQLDKRY